MIGVEGAYIYSFKIGGLDDFITESELASFTLIEEAGGVLPTFEMEFSGNVEEAIALLNETNRFEVSFGSKPDDMVSAPLSIQTKKITRMGATKRGFYLNGLYAASGYLQDSKVSISAKKSAIEVMLEKARSSGFSIHKDNLKKSLDSQVWIQPNISDRKFMTEDLWLHSDLGTGIPALGITSQGEFIIKDVKADGAKEPKWKFTYNATKTNEITYDGDYVTLDNTGFINSWMGYGRQKIIYDLEEGTETTILTKPTPVASMTSKLAKSAEVSKKFSRPAMITDDMHPNYWASHNYNLTNLASLSSTKIILSFQGSYIPIKILDQVFFADDDVSQGGAVASNFNAGRYFVTKVARTLGNRQIATIVELCRESFNDIKTK